MTDPLAVILSDHIWYTTTSRNGKGPFLICKCTAQMADAIEHSEHVARVARNALAAMAAA